MSELVTVTRKSDGVEIIVDINTAQQMLVNNELTIPAQHEHIASTDLYGSDYNNTETLSGT